ncbi:MAG: hemA [Chlamydiales bacterium]|jgi:glutamyl-tRNA reductase|nr:hemA [Chlamydiales bacterium]
MRVAMIGMNYKSADLRLREKVAFAAEHLAQRKDSALSFVVLSTCNRTEIYFSSLHLPKSFAYFIHELEELLAVSLTSHFHVLFGEEVFLHLARVTAGLDSAIAGETEIQGQVKLAYETAKQRRKLMPELHYLFQKALTIGKKVRNEFDWKNQKMNLEHAVDAIGESAFFERKPHILFVGASQINQRIIPFLKGRHPHRITLCNRSLELPDGFPKEIQRLPWEELSRWQEFEWVIVATKSLKPLLSLADLSHKKPKTELILDLGVPRNADPRLAECLSLLNIDEINAKIPSLSPSLQQELKKGGELAEKFASHHFSLFKQKRRAPIHSLEQTLSPLLDEAALSPHKSFAPEKENLLKINA